MTIEPQDILASRVFTESRSDRGAGVATTEPGPSHRSRSRP